MLFAASSGSFWRGSQQSESVHIWKLMASLLPQEKNNAILYVTENGCKWRALPETYGNWHTIYVRMNRWSKNGVLARVFAALQAEGISQFNVEVVCLDSTSVKVHPDGTGALKKEESRRSEGHAADSQRRFIWLPHLTDRLSVFHSPAEQDTIRRKE